MVTKKRVKPQDTDAGEQAAPKRAGRKRKTRTAVSSTSVAEEAIPSRSTRRKRPQTEATSGATIAAVASDDRKTGLSFPRVPPEELRDIGEMSFGRRERTVAIPEFGELSADDISERVRLSSAEITDSPWRKICETC